MKTYFFMCSKFSDLDNMIPVLFQLVDDDSECKAEIVWYGNSVPAQAAAMVDYVINRFEGRVGFWSPFGVVQKNEGDRSPSVFAKIKAKLTAYVAKGIKSRRRSSKFAYEIANHIKDSESCEMCRRVLFFGFARRELLEEVAQQLGREKYLWIRLPQGVVLTVSAFRDDKHLLKPVLPAFLPPWADFGVDVNRHMYDSVNHVRQLMGLKPASINAISFLGSPRYSKKWLKNLDAIYKDKLSAFSFLDPKKKNILLLITPWQKNIWKDEVLRVIQIVSSVLILDSDAVLYIATSVALEAYVRKKQVLQLSYIHAAKTILEDEEVGLMARCRDDVIVAMNNFSKEGVFSKDVTEKNRAEQFVFENIVGEEPMRAFSRHIEKIFEK